jgi:hypothetical protein
MAQFIGEPLINPGASGPNPAATIGIATVFPKAGIVVTIPGIHAMQRMAYTDWIDKGRRDRGLPPLTGAERMSLWREAVDLLVDAGNILIRPDPSRMDLAFAADELLQELVPRPRIRFLFARDAAVRDAINRRGEAWRIQPLPRSIEEMCHLIRTSRVAVRGRPIYYYCGVHGTRILTYAEFAALAGMPDEELRQHLQEIASLAGQYNALGWPEVELFMAGDTLDPAGLAAGLVSTCAPAELRGIHATACRRFGAAVPGQFQQDDVNLIPWRNRMYCTLIAQGDDTLSDEDLLGLSNEYFQQVHWLPGARVEDRELIFDVLPREGDTADATVHELICNLTREFVDVEFVNIGRVQRSLSKRESGSGRREVYLVHFRLRGKAHDELQIIRFLKWGVRERLDQNKPLLQAILESEDYADYILDRRLACQQLGMNLVARLWTRKIQERYQGSQRSLVGTIIWTPYAQRDYIPGVASDKISPAKLQEPQLVRSLARLLGHAAASNLIVGRATPERRVIFDDGDEIIVEDAAGKVTDVVIADPTGAFANFDNDLTRDAPAYAAPINRRLDRLPNPAEFADLYVQAFVDRFGQIQDAYRRHRGAFDTLFSHRQRDPAGNLAHRWAMVLKRLDGADARALGRIIREDVKS